MSSKQRSHTYTHELIHRVAIIFLSDGSIYILRNQLNDVTSQILEKQFSALVEIVTTK